MLLTFIFFSSIIFLVLKKCKKSKRLKFCVSLSKFCINLVDWSDVAERKDENSLEGHKLVLFILAPFYVTYRNNAIYFYGGESWLQRSRPWRYSLKFHRQSEKRIRHKSEFHFRPDRFVQAKLILLVEKSWILWKKT